MKARIAEIFKSVQGEGIYAGYEQIFVRLYGCNLKCAFCDTPLESFKEYSADELVKEIGVYGAAHSISFTGGEPLLQSDFLKEVFPKLRNKGCRIYLETNGTLSNALRKVIEHTDIVAMDIKLPSSINFKGDFWGEHLEFLTVAMKKEVFIKIVITVSTLDEDIVKTIDLLKKANYTNISVLQPNAFDDQIMLQPNLLKAGGLFAGAGLKYRIQGQMHKLMGIK